LFDRPGDIATVTLLEQDPRHERRDAEAEVDGVAIHQLHRRAPGDDLVRPPLDRIKRVQRRLDLAAYGGVVRRLGRLHLLRVDDDVVDQIARHPHLLSGDRASSCHSLDLRDNDAAIVPGG
jgi:hypothetical protein